MKKKLTAIILTAALTASLAACSQQTDENMQENNSADTTSATTTTSAAEEETTSAAEEETTSAAEENQTNENTIEPSADVNPNTNEENQNSQNQSENDTSGNESECQRLTEVVLNAVEFPSTMKLEDEEIITDTVGLNLDDIEEYCITQQMMSVHLVEIIIAKPKEGKAESVLETLQARKDALINTFAFYPDQEESANATVVGQKGDYVYLICHAQAADAEKELLENIS